MKQITLTIDGRQVTGPEGATILEVARANGVDIPTLCNDEKLEPYGSCFLCICEVEGARRLMPACATKATEGMIVKTETDQIRTGRTMCLELLLSDHVGDCLGPCTIECPGDLDPQGYIAHAAAGRYDEAIRLIKSKLPMPASIGRVCPRPCETKCRRNVIGEPVAIDAIKRFIADWDLLGDRKPFVPAVKRESGKKVAIVGAGPAGLTAAWFLSLEGHKCVIHEMMPKPGGMFRYGIPEYRLPYDVLDKEIDVIASLGAEIRYGQKLGKDISVKQLREEYDAVLIATGAWKASSMRCEGEELDGVWGGIDYLRAYVEGRDTRIGDKVIVVGGGNTAIDAARTAWREGAQVTILYRRTRAEMPAHPDEIAAALHEEVDIRFLAAPVKIEKSGDALKMTCIRMELGEPDASGRRRPVPIQGSEFEIEATAVISAIGQKVDNSWMKGDLELDQTMWGSIAADENTGKTKIDGVFAAGDCATGADIAIKAIGGARKTAMAIDRYLRGEAVEYDEPVVYNHSRGSNDDIDKEIYRDVERIDRERLPEISLEKRRGNNEEVELTYSEEQMLREASRCLECGCQDVDECELRAHATRYKLSGSRLAGDYSPGELDYSHPFILREPRKCIKCARCIRTCLENQGVGAWGFVGRGFNAVVEPTFGKPLDETDCESCGSCVAACPTGALLERVPGEKPGPFHFEYADSVCTECGMGCSVRLAGTGAHLLKVLPREVAHGTNKGNLCKRGRFERVFEEADRIRITEPMLRRNGKLCPVSWDEAYKEAARILTEAGPGKSAVFVSPGVTNEDAYIAGKFARKTLRTNNIGTLDKPDRSSWDLLLSDGIRASSFEVIGGADLLIFVDPETLERNVVVGNHVLAALKNGADALVIGQGESKFDWTDAIKIDCARSDIGRVLFGLNNLLGKTGDLNADVEIPGCLEDEKAIIEAMLKEAKRPVIVLNRELTDAEGIEQAANLYNAFKGTPALVALYSKANTAGLVKAGIAPHILPGPVAIDSEDGAGIRRSWGDGIPADSGQFPADLLQSGELAAALLVGEDPFGDDSLDAELKAALAKVPSLVVIDSHLSRTAEKADVLLPAPAGHELDGTFTNSEERVQRLRPLAAPRAGKRTFCIISGLANELEGREVYKTDIDSETVYKEFAGLVGGEARSYQELV